MYRLKRAIDLYLPTKNGLLLANLSNQTNNKSDISLHPSFRHTTYRFLDLYQLGSKDAIQKERARITDEMNRGYFADIKEFKKHGGKVSEANKVIIPAMAAVKFPSIEVNSSDGTNIKLPITCQDKDVVDGKIVVPGVSLVCLSFRAHSQAMIDSWTAPFLNTFNASHDVIRMYEVSMIDSWFLSLRPIKHLLLWTMRKPKPDGTTNNTLSKQTVYAFGDHYYFRKELKILNLLTGYIFLVDRFGRIRWQGSGSTTEEELASLLACTSLLLEEK
ncbi:hypothetical protein ACHQM5_005482 [Ranunculus cassubicifolius]